jgi:alpha-beta hydrolase superfamily lysophospholipase
VYLRAWEPAGRPRGAGALVHGLGEHVGGFLAGRGFIVIAPDLPGHGRNHGKRGCTSFPQIPDVIDALVAETRRRAATGRPVFLYEHSLGGNRVLAWQITRPAERLAGVVASSPSLGEPEPKPPAITKALGRFLARVAPTVTMENGLDLDALNRDPAVNAAARADPLYHTRFSALLGVGILDSWSWFSRGPGGTLASPALILQGTGDRCAEPQATIDVARRLSGDVTLKTWEGFFRELHNEPEQGEVLGFIAGWMDKHLA